MSASHPPAPASYAEVGVDAAGEERAMEGLLGWVYRSFSLRGSGPGRVALPVGYFASVVEIAPDLGLAFSTDGVGTKLLVAQQVGRFDTVGIDCVAMNVNDIICVGAEPLSVVDYLAVQEADPALLEEIGRGLYAGAERAGVTICGGEVAQVREMLAGAPGSRALDLAAACVGLVPLDRVIVGADIQPGDVVLGLASSGLHSNGYTLARRVLLGSGEARLDEPHAELGRSLADELLQPTRIYVREVMAMLRAELRVKSLAHITSDGLLNLTRVARTDIGYEIDYLPDPPPIFRLIQRMGGIGDAEMYAVFNMGIGFCLVLHPEDLEKAADLARAEGSLPMVLGSAVLDPKRRVRLRPLGLVGQGSGFKREGEDTEEPERSEKHG